MTSIACMRHLLGICITSKCVIIIISFRKLDLTSQTSNVCNILCPLYHGYFQRIGLAMFKVIKQCLIWDFFCSFSCWTPRHGQKSPMRGSVLLFVRPPYSLSILPSGCEFSQNWLFCFFWNLACFRGPYLVICDSRIFLKQKWCQKW